MKSIWISQLKNKQNIPTYEVLQGKHTFDVAVIGGGITGLSTAIKLKESGKKVVLIEGDRIGCGVTGFSTAKITSLHGMIYADLNKKFGEDKARLYAMMNEQGLQHIKDNIKKYNIDCEFQERPAITYTQVQAMVEEIKQEAEAAAKAGLKASFLLDTNFNELPFQVKAAVRVEDQAQFNSYAYCVGLAKAINDNGCQVFERSRVLSISVTSPHEIKTPEGSVEANSVVVATHIPIIDRTGHFAMVKPVRSYCMAFSLFDKNKIPKGMYISTGEGETKISLRSCCNDEVLIVGGSGHNVGEAPGGDTTNCYKEIEAWARDNFPIHEEIARWSAQDYMPPDHVPYIGKAYKGTKSLFTATGFQKWGISAGSAAGILITDLIQERENQWESLFDATRWDIVNSAPGLVSTNVHVAKHLVGDRIKHAMEKHDIEDLVRGTGGICQHKGKTVGGYRDEDGNLFAVSCVCTHLGCHVEWNQAEKSWDCPCHGSRFSYEGTLLHGPAVNDLEKYPV